MFIHAIRVPQNYKKAAKLLQKVKEQGASLSKEIYGKPHGNIQKIYALVVETLKHYSEIEELVEKSDLFEKEKRLDPWLARILLTELLWRKGELKGESKPVKTILSYQNELESFKSAIIPKVVVKKEVSKPRFVRVNTLKLTVNEAVDGFREQNWTLVRPQTDTYEDFITQASSLNSGEFMVDMHIKEMLLFPEGTKFFNHQAYLNYSIILQDKSSCLPVTLLNPPPNSVVLDMCAAPGMKTSFLAAKINNQGTIYAVERDNKRFETLNKTVENIGATCIKTINQDALTVRADDCPNVEYILVDPSCTGTGMTKRLMEFKDEQPPSAERLKKLSGIQIILLKHALIHFPQAKRVVYSTCSIYSEENEYVVKEVLKCTSNFKLVSAKKLLNGESVESEEEESVEDKCFNLNIANDLTNGFFVAVFERTAHDTNEKVNKILNKKRNNSQGSDTTEVVGEQTENFLEVKKQKEIPEVKASQKKGKKRQVDSSLVKTESEPKKIKTEEVEENANVESNKKKKKKKKNKATSDVITNASQSKIPEGLEKVKKKKKKNKQKVKNN